jgi:hypothetical protein
MTPDKASGWPVRIGDAAAMLARADACRHRHLYLLAPEFAFELTATGRPSAGWR